MPEMRQQEAGAAVGSRLRYHLEEELSGIGSGNYAAFGASVVNARDLQRYKRLLLAKLDELSATRGRAETLVPGAGGGQGDLIDQANSDAEAELQVRLHQSDARLLRAIEGALARIRRGPFGVCEACKQAISKARLEAVPWTCLCRECKERPRA